MERPAIGEAKAGREEQREEEHPQRKQESGRQDRREVYCCGSKDHRAYVFPDRTETAKSHHRSSETKKSGRDSKRQKTYWNKFVRREEREDWEDDDPDSNDKANKVFDFILS